MFTSPVFSQYSGRKFSFMEEFLGAEWIETKRLSLSFFLSNKCVENCTSITYLEIILHFPKAPVCSERLQKTSDL